MFVFVDGDDVFGAFHAGQVLDGAADANGYIERGLDGLAGLPDLVTVWQPAGVDDGAGGAWSAAQGSRQFLYKVVVFGFAEAAPAADDDAGIFEGGSFAL